MVESNIKFCITNFLTGKFFNEKGERSEIVGLKIFRSNRDPDPNNYCQLERAAEPVKAGQHHKAVDIIPRKSH